MSKRNCGILIEDMIQSIEKIERYTKNLSEDQFFQNKMVIDAVIWNIQTLGEAAKQLPESIRNNNPQIPWNQLMGIRNPIVHEYFGIDTKIIWFIVNQEILILKQQLINISL